MGNEFTDTLEDETIGQNPTDWTEVTENGVNNVEVVSTSGIDMQSAKCCMLEINQTTGAASIRKEITESNEDFRVRAKIRFDNAQKNEGGNAMICVWGGTEGEPTMNYAFIRFRFVINADEDALDLQIYNDDGNEWVTVREGLLAFDTSYEVELRGYIAGQWTDFYLNDNYIGSYAVEEIDFAPLVNHNMLSVNAYGIAAAAASSRMYFDNVRWDSTGYIPSGGYGSMAYLLEFFDFWLPFDWDAWIQANFPTAQVTAPPVKTYNTVLAWLLGLGIPLGIASVLVYKFIKKK